MFSENMAEVKNKYMEFVLKETPKEISGIFNRKKWPSIIESDEFIHRVKKRFFNIKRHKEIPASKTLATEIGEIKEVVCNLYGIKEEELLYSRRGSKNEALDMGIYSTRHLRGSKLTEIGMQFNVNSYSTLSTIIERMKEKIEKEGKIN